MKHTIEYYQSMLNDQDYCKKAIFVIIEKLIQENGWVKK